MNAHCKQLKDYQLFPTVHYCSVLLLQGLGNSAH